MLPSVPDAVRTDRLLLRRWRPGDLPAFAELNADHEVMAHFPAPLTRDQSDALAARADAHLAEHGWGLWAVEELATGRFAGFTGLAVPAWTTPFGPAVEVGWRLARWAWGHGYATEAATAALEQAFERIGLDEVLSFTAKTNLRSVAVMRRLGMTHDPADDFDHPKLPPGHRLRPHVLYRLSATDWRLRHDNRESAPQRTRLGSPRNSRG
jgi:RimJ/RimL family protein N-acetyltransferase